MPYRQLVPIFKGVSVETKTATQQMVGHFNGLPFVHASLVGEAGSPSIH
jgi:hypothetical protein